MKSKIAAVALFACVAMICSESNGQLLDRMLGRGGCGGGCETATPCCDTPAPSCGRINISINLSIGKPGRLFGRCGGGMLSSIGDCCAETKPCDNACENTCDNGCGGGFLSGFSGLFQRNNCCEPAPVEADPCGCDNGGLLSGGLFSGGLFSRLKGNGDCCCEAPAPAPAPACAPACEADPCGCGLDLRGKVSGMMSRVRPSGGCGGCGEPADQCGCGGGLDLRGKVSGMISRVRPSGGCGECGEPADQCGCGGGLDLRGKVSGMISRVRPSGGCGECGEPADQCGCDSASLLDRVRAMRPRIGSCNDGCNTGCQNSGCSDCHNGDTDNAPTAAPVDEAVVPIVQGTTGA